jgi:cytosine permease
MAERNPKVAEKASLTEDYGTKPVPAGEGKGWFGISMVYWGSAMCLPSFFIAALVAGPKTLGSSILIYVVASLALGGLAVLTGIFGAKTRLSSGLTARFTFGFIGANVLQVLMFFACWGWFGVQLGFMVTGFGDGGLMLVLGNALPAWFWTILGGALITVTAVVGFKAIEKLSIVAMPLIVIILVVTIIREYSGGQSFAAAAAVTGPNAMPFGVAVSTLIGSYIIGVTVTPDVTRYAKNRKAAGWGMLSGMAGGFVVVLTLGAIMVKGAGGEFDFSKIILQGGSVVWSILAVVTIVLASWTTNDVNLYSGSLSINAMFPKMNKVMITVVSGVIGTGLALLGINTAAGFQTFLGIIAILIPPAVAIMIVDYYMFKGERNQEYDSDKTEKLPKLRAMPFVSWMVGAGFGFIAQYTPVKLTSITAIDAIIVSAVVYFVVMLITKNKVKVSA